MAEKTYLICEVSEGMFPNEKCIVVRDTDGSFIADGFFPNTLIKENKLLVYMHDAKHDKVIVRAAGAGHEFSGGQRHIVVPKSLIVVVEE